MRPQDWPSLLSGYVEKARRTPHAWGSHDCATFSCGWYALATGVDVYAPLRGKYESEIGAARIMIERGWNDMEAVGNFFFGTKHKRVIDAYRGDIVCASDQFNVLALGVSVGAHGAFLSQDGVRLIPFRQFKQVWAVD